MKTITESNVFSFSLFYNLTSAYTEIRIHASLNTARVVHDSSKIN